MNAENIKPYARLVQRAAEEGGPELFLRQHALINQQIGIAMEKSTQPQKALYLAGIVIAVWEGGKWVYKKVKAKRKARLQELQEVSIGVEIKYNEAIRPFKS